MEERDHYEVLGLHASADHAMVVQAYWHLARKYKAAMDEDGASEQALDELNRSFEVLASPERRQAYDHARMQETDAFEDDAPTHRVSIEVAYWYLPAWQAMVAATAALALAATALVAGAQPVLTVLLASVTVGVALLAPAADRALAAAHSRWLALRRRRNTLDFERSTAAAIERWRQGEAADNAGPTLANLFRGADDCPRPFNARAGRRPDKR
jgi:hypothetical protein